MPTSGQAYGPGRTTALGRACADPSTVRGGWRTSATYLSERRHPPTIGAGRGNRRISITPTRSKCPLGVSCRTGSGQAEASGAAHRQAPDASSSHSDSDIQERPEGRSLPCSNKSRELEGGVRRRGPGPNRQDAPPTPPHRSAPPGRGQRCAQEGHAGSRARRAGRAGEGGRPGGGGRPRSLGVVGGRWHCDRLGLGRCVAARR